MEYFDRFCRQRKKFQLSGKVFPAWLPQVNYTCPLERFEEEKAALKTILSFFVIFRQGANFFGPLPNSSNMIVETVLYVSFGTLWGKLFFFWTNFICNFFLFGHWTNSFVFRAKLFWLLSIFLRQDCQNCLLLVLKNSLRECFFPGEKIMFFNVFRHWLKKVRAFEKSFPDGFVKTAFHVSTGTFRG